MSQEFIYLALAASLGGFIGYFAGLKLKLTGFVILTALVLGAMYLIFASPTGGGAWDGIAQTGYLVFIIFPFLLCYVIAALAGFFKRRTL